MPDTPRRYDPRRKYSAALDVRDWTELADRIRGEDPEGALWPLVGPRRSGKTWALRGLAAQLGGSALFIDLHDHGDLGKLARRPNVRQSTILLLDEPGRHLFAPGEVGPATPRIVVAREAERFLAWCRDLRDDGRRVVLAMSPAEWSALRAHGRQDNHVNDKDLQPHLRPLDLDQARRIAGLDHPPALALVERLARDRRGWLQSPFLLTLALEAAAQRGHLDGPGEPALPPAELDALLAIAIDHAQVDLAHKYVDFVFYEGLDPAQQGLLRALARGGPIDRALLRPLLTGGLVEETGPSERPRIADPILAAHLPPPLRIHHVSDVHFGAKAATRVYASGTPAAARLGDAAGHGVVADSYAEHLEALAARGEAPHLLIVTGDLVEVGADDEYAAARAWLERLTRSLAPHPDLRDGDPRVLLAPGNHDVDWRLTRGPAGARDRHRRFAAAFPDRPRPRLEDPPESRPLALHRYPDAGLALVLLGSAEYGGEIDDLLIEVIDRARDQALQAGLSGQVEEAQRLRDRLGRIDPGLVHQEDLRRLRGAAIPEPVRIAALHHPISPLPSSVDIAPYAGLVNAGAVKDALIDRRFTLVLHGHLHSQWFGEERWPGHQRGDHTLRIASAPSLGSREVHEHHGFNAVELHREGPAIVAVTVRAFRRQGDTWHLEAPALGPFRPAE